MIDCLRRGLWLITLGTFLATASGCTTTRHRLLEDELARDGTGLTKEKGQRIKGYELRGGEPVEFNGRVRVTEQDSLMFWQRVATAERSATGASRWGEAAGPVYDQESVTALEVMHHQPVATTFTILGVTTLFLVAITAAAAANWDMGSGSY